MAAYPQRQEEARRNEPAGELELGAVEATKRVRHLASLRLAEEELSIEELDLAAGEYAPYISNVV